MANAFFGGNLWNADFRFAATDFFAVGSCGAINGLVTVEARQQLVLRAAGTISFFTVNVTSNTSAANVTVKLRNQSGNLNSTLAVNTGTGQFQDTTHSDSMASGDKLAGSPTGGTSLSHMTISPIGMKWAPSSGTNSFLTGVHSGAGLAASTTYYLPSSGALGGASNGGMSSEAIAQNLCRAAFTASNLFCEVATNTNTNAVTYDFRNNAGSGAQTLSIGAAVTGYQEDVTHTDSVVSGDKFNCRMVFGAGTIGFTPQLYGFLATYGGNIYELISSNNATTNTLSTSADGFFGLLGQYENAQATESKAQTKYSHAETFQNLRVYVETTNANFTIKFRVNGSTVNQTTGTLGSSGWAEDVTHTDTIVANDLVNMIYVHGSGAVSIKSLVVTGGVASINATGSGNVGTITLSSAAGAGNVATGTGLGTIALSAPAGQGQAAQEADGSIPTIALSAPAGQGNVGAGTDIGTIVLTSLEAIGTAGEIASGDIGTITLSPPSTQKAQATQFGLSALANRPSAEAARLTQFGLSALVQPDAIVRITQMGLLVLAAGGETPLTPNPLSLRDFGRDQLIYQRMVNMYVEPTPQGPGTSARYPRPGFYNLTTRGAGPIRATFSWHGFRFTVSGGNVFRDADNIGSIPAHDRCRFAFSDEEIVLVSGGIAWYVDKPDLSDTAIIQIIDPDLPPNVVDVAFLAGRFVYINADTSQFYYSEVGDARSIDGLSFATAAENTADRIVAVDVISDNLVFFLGESLEWWYPSSDPDNPYYRSQGRRNDKGLAAQGSVIECDNSLFFMGNDRMIYRAAAVPMRVSDFSVEDKIRRVITDDLPNCTAFTLSYGGHTFYGIHLIGFGTWVLDIGQKLWYEWKSYNHPLLRVGCADQGFIGDMYSGQILGVDGKTYSDIGDPIERVVSTFLRVEKAMTRNYNLLLSCARGVGNAVAPGDNPMVEMRFSDHEGRNWSPWIPAPLGQMGDAGEGARAIWTHLGGIRPPGRLFEFRCSEPVFFAPWEVRFNEPRL